MQKKVLIFEPEITENGVSKILADFMQNFDKRIDYRVLTFCITNDIYMKSQKQLIYEIGHIKNVIHRIHKEYKIMKEYDVVHINGNYISRVIECLAARMAGVPKIIIHSHNNGYENNQKLKVFIHKNLKWLFSILATDYVACSESAAKWMFSKSVIKRKKYQIINNGIDIDKFKFNNMMRTKIRKQYQLEDKFVIGTVGRFVYQKNHTFLLDVFALCCKKNENAVLLLVGNGPLKKELQKKSEALGVADKVLFVGNSDKVYQFYNAMDCFVLSSRYEGLGIVNIEAQASGLHTIVSDVVPKETKVSGLIQYLSLQEDKEKWADCILEDNDLKLRKLAYKNILDNKYDIQSAAQELEKIYFSK